MTAPENADRGEAEVWRNEAERMQRYLHGITGVNKSFVTFMKSLLQKPHSGERERSLLAAVEALELANNAALSSGLGRFDPEQTN